MKKRKVTDTIPGQMMERYEEEFPGIFAAITRERAKVPPGSLPSWCDTPDRVTTLAMAPYLGPDIINRMVSTPPERINEYPELKYPNFKRPTCTALYLWNKTKSIYRFDKTLSEELSNTDFDSTLPTEILFRMPEWCLFVDVSENPINGVNECFFAFLNYDVIDEVSELYLMPLMTANKYMCLPIRIYLGEGLTLEESLWRVFEHDLRRPRSSFEPEHLKEMEEIKVCATQMLYHVLYLCSDKPDVKNHNPYSTRQSPRRERAVEPFVTQWDVGVRIGARIRKSMERKEGVSEEEKANSGFAGEEKEGNELRQLRRRPRPHVRRAHWHHFWRGPRDGERELIVKWLHPAFVNLTEGATDIPAVVRKVEA